MTSAATPLFQQMPSATLHPCRNAGSTAGSQMAFTRRPSGRRNTRAISSSCGSALSSPVRTAPYSTGSTIKKLMRMERLLPLTHTSARMIKLATGVAWTSCITGASMASTQSQRSAATANSTLHTPPSTKPSRMCPALNATRCQNSAWGSSCTSVPKACSGDTRNTSCPMAMAAPCHTASQNTTAASQRRRFFVCFILLPFCSFQILFQDITSSDRIQAFIFSFLDMSAFVH